MMQGGPSLPIRPATRRALLLTAVAVLVVSVAVPTALAEAETDFPFKEMGVGKGDVSDEPSTDADSGDPGNLFPHTEFSPGAPTLILDSYYVYEVFPLTDLEINNMLRVTADESGLDQADEEAGTSTTEKHMYLGFGTFQAWWGWWQDKGRVARMNDAPFQFRSDQPDGAIQDAHDDHTTWDDPWFHYGEWDEFVWRGDNPWADTQQTFSDTQDVNITSYPEDEMVLFWHPGTHETNARQPPIPGNKDSAYFLRNDSDDEDVADMVYTDHTDMGPYASPGNPQDGGWHLENRRTSGTYDDGLLITTKIETSVNPDGSGPSYTVDQRRSGATAYDVDYYSAVAPEVETLYRTAVWDPQDSGHQGNNVFSEVNDEGPKQEVHDRFTDVWLNADDTAITIADQLLDPTTPAVGAADDAAGKKAWRHEPNRVGDEYGANFDGATGPDATYGVLAGSTNDYYEPGNGQSYGDYQAGEHAWLDTQAGWGIPLYLFNFNMFGTMNLRPVHSVDGLAGGEDQPGSPPGILGVSTHFGTWYDANEDTWVGDVDEEGRWSSSSDPYNRGVGDPADTPDDPFYQARGDDPNDYQDTPDRTRMDPAKSEPAEWLPLCEGADVTATLTPKTDGERWGAAGVYVIRDADKRGNPYDDVVTDAVGIDSEDGQPASRLVLNGPITVDLQCRDANTGLFFGDTWIVSPTGTADYPVEVETTAIVEADRDQRFSDGSTLDNLKGEKVVDVDVLGSLQGD